MRFMPGQRFDNPLPTPLASSYSPCTVARIPKTGDLLIVWNQVSGDEIRAGYRRGRLSSAISKDDGRTWTHYRTIDTAVLPPAGRVEPDTEPQMARGLDYVGVLPEDYGGVDYATISSIDDSVFLFWQRSLVNRRPGDVIGNRLRVLPLSWFYADESDPTPDPKLVLRVPSGASHREYEIAGRFSDDRFFCHSRDVMRYLKSPVGRLDRNIVCSLHQVITMLGWTPSYDRTQLKDASNPRLIVTVSPPQPYDFGMNMVSFSRSVALGALIAQCLVGADRMAVVVGEKAPEVEQYAAAQLCDYLSKLFGIQTQPVTSLTKGVNAILLVGSPKTNGLIKETAAASQFVNLGDQGIVVERTSLAKQPAVVVGGGSPQATLWAAYELIERYWGVRYLLHGDVLPPRAVFRLPDAHLRLEPSFPIRQWRVVNEFACGPASWGLADYRPVLDQLAKIKFNRLLIVLWPHHPFLDYEYAGVSAFQRQSFLRLPFPHHCRYARASIVSEQQAILES